MGKILKKDLEAIEPCKRQKDMYYLLKAIGVEVGSYGGFHKSCFKSGKGATKKGGLWHLNVQWAWSNLKYADTGDFINDKAGSDAERYNKARADREEAKAARERRQNDLEEKRVIDKSDVYPMVISRLIFLQKQFFYTWEKEVGSLLEAAGGNESHRAELQSKLNESTKSVFSEVFGVGEEVKVTIESALKEENE